MFELEEIQRRVEKLESDLAKGKIPSTPAELSAIATDLRTLVREIEELRSLCHHSHTLQLHDELGLPIAEFVCVNCHKRLTGAETELSNEGIAPDDEL